MKGFIHIICEPLSMNKHTYYLVKPFNDGPSWIMKVRESDTDSLCLVACDRDTDVENTVHDKFYRLRGLFDIS